MKLFKKLLAVTLVAVLALTVFTACDGASSDDIPSDNTALSYFQSLNDGAEKYNGGGTLGALPYCKRYNANLENVSTDKLSIYIRWVNDNAGRKNDEAVNTEDKRDNEIDKIEIVSKNENKYESVMYKVFDGRPDYQALYEETDKYRAADTVSIIRMANDKNDGGDGKTYTIIEFFRKVN